MMYVDIPIWLSVAMMIVGLVALAWSSDTFVKLQMKDH